MSRLPLLALVTDAFGGHGGIAQYNRDLLTAIALADDVLVVPRMAPRPFGDPPRGVRQESARPGRAAYIGAAVAAARRVRPAIVFCGHLYMAPLAVVIARMVGASMVLQLHGVEVWERPDRMRRTAAEAADKVLCVSRDTRARFLRWAAIGPERVAVLPNTVSERFCPGDRAAARAKFGLGSKRALLSVGRQDPRERYKGYDRVIEALPKLVGALGDVVYLLAGTGHDRAWLEALAAERGVADRVRFLGHVDNATLPDLYRAANIFVMPSTGEGFGIAYLEAMACGTPALGLAAGGAPDALADGELGIMADPHADLVEALASALEARQPHPDALAAEVERRFGREHFAERARAAIGTVTGTLKQRRTSRIALGKDQLV